MKRWLKAAVESIGFLMDIEGLRKFFLRENGRLC